jgi:UPF0716 family protein affecting phage T7 exclusion
MVGYRYHLFCHLCNHRKDSQDRIMVSFFAILLLWAAMALFKSIPNNHLLATRVAEMLGVNSWLLVLFISALLGAFVAAVSGFCGYHFRKAVLRPKINT